MKKKIPVKKYIVVWMALALAAVMLCSCAEVRVKTPSKKDALILLGNASLSRQEGVFLLMEEKAAYEKDQSAEEIWQQPAGSVTLSKYVKDVVEEKLIRYTAAEILSDQLAVYPSEDEKNQAAESAVTAWTKISGLYDMEAYDISVEDVHDLYDKKAVYQAVYNKITNDAAETVTEAGTRVMLADYLLVPSSAGEEEAQKVRKAVLDGADFQDACAAEHLSPLTNQMVKRGELPTEVDNIAFALKDGELSEVIQSKSGFYLIRCLDDNLLEESAANYNAILSRTKEEAFQMAWDDFSKETKLYLDTNWWKQIEPGEIK